MVPRIRRGSIEDAIAGIALILFGSLAFIVKLGFFNMNNIPWSLQHRWPLLLIGLGVILWVSQQPSSGRSGNRRSPKNPRGEANYGR